MFRPILAKQFGKPDGFWGLMMGRLLNRVNARINRLTLGLMAVRPTDHVLDIGFGGGLMLGLLLNSTPRGFVAGVEISGLMLKRARRKFRWAVQAGRLAIEEASVTDLPFRPGQFNKACAVNAIYFWPDPAAGLREIHRVLEPGGLLVLAFRPKAFLEGVKFTQHGFTAFAEEELQTMLESAGFATVRFERRDDKDMGAIFALANRV